MAKNTSGNSSVPYTIAALLIATIFFAILFWRDMNLINHAYNDSNQIEFLSSTTQRLIGLAHSKHEVIIAKDVFFIDDSTKKYLTPNGDDSLTILNNATMVLLANEVLISWEKINLLLNEEEINTIDLSLARDSHYKAMTNLSDAIGDFTHELNNNIANYQLIISFLISVIAVTMLNSLLVAHDELVFSKKLAETAQIDTATGLYNRSCCQELFKTTPANNRKRPAILVIDLNDLKKVNDSQGHRVGDELISSFANVLKTAGNVHVTKPFLGRYGGDEFIIFYENVAGEDEIKIFIKELEFLTEEFNNNESRFKIFYAIGYSYISGIGEDLTIRQLFDKADTAMYENKIAGKRARDPEFDKKMAEGVDLR